MGKLAINGGTPVRTKPLGVPWPECDDREIEAVAEVIRSRQWGGTPGTVVREFEKEMAAFCGAKYAICLTNGTAAIEVALRAVGVEAGDEVIVSPYTFIATASAPAMIGAIPVFVDIEPGTGNMDPELIEAAITERTKAIVPVHIHGRPANMDGIMAVARRHGLKVVEDACQAQGSEWRGQRVGTFGDAGAISHQNSKAVNCGEGGTIVTNDEDVYLRCYSLVNIGRVPDGEFYQHEYIGSNYRLSNIHAAIARVQLTRWADQSRRRSENGAYLNSLMQDIDGISTMDRDERITFHIRWIHDFRYHPERFGGVPRARFREALAAEGIGCGNVYQPLYRNGLFKRFSAHLAAGAAPGTRVIDYASLALPVVENFCDNEDVTLGYTALLGPRQDMDDIAEAVRKISENRHELE
jgi:dTDP-4-amino-4,6-dideoxygalactose transaminase